MGYVVAAVMAGLIAWSVYLVRTGSSGAAAKVQAKQAAKAEKERDEATRDIRSNTRRLRDLLGL